MADANVLGLIPARGGSKGIRRKNLREVEGGPLIEYSIRAGLESSVIDSVVVSTDHEEIAEVANAIGARVPFMRPPALATDEAPTAPVITHALEELRGRGEEYEAFVLLQPTSPLRTAIHIDDAFSIFEDSNADSVVSVYPTCEERWERTEEGAQKLNYNDAGKRRQDREPEYVVNGAIYVTDTSQFLETGKPITGIVGLYEMSERESVDVDTHFDLWLVRKIVKKWGHNV
ncbi:N-acylneuraminate cytidylyltransferase/CMP-N,N'-diacetyllegionaminic acid synthase [Salinibacter ruber]|nr:N-acylneuraminate cytidylyltransferase/CMP-N,N'-diacetyllegionaminic acid synthase [Salinibacter ruber]